jgi:dihydroxy-acid dehydratase
VLAKRLPAGSKGTFAKAGVLGKYAATVGPASAGAVTHSGAVDWPEDDI